MVLVCIGLAGMDWACIDWAGMCSTGICWAAIDGLAWAGLSWHGLGWAVMVCAVCLDWHGRSWHEYCMVWAGLCWYILGWGGIGRIYPHFFLHDAFYFFTHYNQLPSIQMFDDRTRSTQKPIISLPFTDYRSFFSIAPP